MKNFETFCRAKRVARVIYLVSGLEDMVTFLDAKEECGDITEEENDTIVDRVTKQCADMTVAEINKIRSMF